MTTTFSALFAVPAFASALTATDAPLIPAAVLAALPLAAPAVPFAPFALFGGFVAAFVLFLALRRGMGSQAYRLRLLSPERIAAHRHDMNALQTIEALAASISERAAAICQAVAEDGSEIRAEMCAIGYRRCADDMITLTHRIEEESPSSPLLRRMRMKRARNRAVEALVRARKCLPQEALRATRQEQ